MWLLSVNLYSIDVCTTYVAGHRRHISIIGTYGLYYTSILFQYNPYIHLYWFPLGGSEKYLPFPDNELL